MDSGTATAQWCGIYTRGGRAVGRWGGRAVGRWGRTLGWGDSNLGQVTRWLVDDRDHPYRTVCHRATYRPQYVAQLSIQALFMGIRPVRAFKALSMLQELYSKS